MTYIDENGNKYYVGWSGMFYEIYKDGKMVKLTRFGVSIGLKSRDGVEAFLASYAVTHKLLPYPEAICSACAQAVGKTWPDGHIGTFYDVKCGVCGKVAQCTEPRDYCHFTTSAELKVLYAIARLGTDSL